MTAAVAKRVNTKLGARDVRRVIEEHIEHPLTDILLDRPNTTQIRVDASSIGTITLRPVKTLRRAIPLSRKKITRR